MFEHILVAYDGSDNADRALEAGGRMAQGLGAKLAVLHNLLEGPVPEQMAKFAPRTNSAVASDTVGGFYDAASLQRDELEAIATKLLEHARAAVKSMGVADAEVITTSGDAARRILEHAREHGVDTILVGSRDHAPLAEWLLGSVAHKLHDTFEGAVITVR